MGGGWTVIQRRQDGSVDFQRNWNDYSNGFGHLKTEFWFGNKNIHDLTKVSAAPKKSTLLINMRMKGKSVPVVFAKYSSFSIGNAASKYVLHISGFSGNASKPKMHIQNKMKFSTFDQDNDTWNKNCASTFKAGWWYSKCYVVNLNAPFHIPKFQYNMVWNLRAKPIDYPSFVEMKIRRNY